MMWTPWLENPWVRVAVALVTGILTFIFLRLLLGLIGRVLSRSAERSGAFLPQYAASVLDATSIVVLVYLAVVAAAAFFEPPAWTALILARAGTVLLYIQLGLWMNRLVEVHVKRRVELTLKNDPSSATMINALGVVARVAVWSLTALFVLEALTGMQAPALIASLGVGGIAVGLAVQNSVGDLFSSLALSMDQPFVIGDAIEVGGLQGRVEQIGLRTTRVRSTTGELIVLPNSYLTSTQLKNLKQMESRLVIFRFSVNAAVDVDRLAAIPGEVKDWLSEIDGVVFERCTLSSIQPAGVNSPATAVFNTLYRLSDPAFDTYMRVQEKVNLMLMERLKAGGVELVGLNQA